MAHTELDLRERRVIEDMLNAKMSVGEIAADIGRHRSNVYREIKRNTYRDDELPELNGYHAVVAQDRYADRRAVHRKLIRYPDIMAAVRSGFDAGWSPEQIAGRMRLERHSARVHTGLKY